MSQIYACVDGLPPTAAVVDWSVWASLRLGAPLHLLHALNQTTEMPPVGDYSGALGTEAQEILQQQLSTLDAQRYKIAQEVGRQILDGACARARSSGVPDVTHSLHYGDLVDTLLSLEADARLCVLGENHSAHAPRKLYLSHHLERVVRAIQRPILVTTAAPFAPPERFVLAYDGSDTARKTVDMVARSPLLQGLPALIAMAAADTTAAHAALGQAQAVLHTAGFAVTTTLLAGDPEQALPKLLKTQGAALLVMGAYGHSRIRQLVLGSSTTALLRLSPVPVLVLR
ncbi:universal stress protein [Simplicispira psychrophila]|uniref:universal stress protein n=1 Tax=Simplicispira psychrophila TaxID=80882 RepID=UPI0004842E90|nr:universal stress protein [Simplicispira psychrophila]